MSDISLDHPIEYCKLKFRFRTLKQFDHDLSQIEITQKRSSQQQEQLKDHAPSKKEKEANDPIERTVTTTAPSTNLTNYRNKSSIPSRSISKLILLYWASKIDLIKELKQILSKHHNLLADTQIVEIKIEDAFIRSNGLGSNFFYPYSLIFDRSGIYYDPSESCDLEYILATLKTREDYNTLREQALELQQRLIKNNITKYAQGTTTSKVNHATSTREDLQSYCQSQSHDRIIFIPAQVDQDASILLGGCDQTNLSLLKTVRQNNPKAFIIFKIHPDLIAGNRDQQHDQNEYTQYCNLLVTTQYSNLDCIQASDEIHTISSLTGFEALIRNKKVYCYGMPFYAGYSLTIDQALKNKHPLALKAYERRSNIKIDLIDLMIASLILYPIYYNWDLKRESSVNETIDTLLAHKPSKQNKLYFLISKSYRTFKKLFFLPLTQRLKKPNPKSL